MSTPTGRPFNPGNVFDYAPKKVRERAALQGQSTAGDAADRSSEAPIKPRQQPAETHPADADADADENHDTPLAPTGPHELPADEPDDGEHPPPPFGPKDARQDEAAEDGLAKGDYDHDLSRLESRLQHLRRERAERSGEQTPLPHPARLGLRPPDALGRDSYIDGFRLPRSLGPTFVPPPPLREERTSHLALALRVAVACAIAAPVAYYFSVGGSVAPRKSDKGPMLSSAETRVVELTPGRAASSQAAPLQATPQQTTPPQAAPPQAAPVPLAQKQVDQVPAVRMPVAQMQASQPAPRPNETRPDTASPAQGDRVGMLTAGANPPAPVAKPVRAIDPEAVKLLLTQGEQFLNTGDLVTARLLFRRAAEAGDADGALALGATYDPGVLAKLGVRGISADVDQARSWYEKAGELGSPEAARRLKILANR